MTEAETINKLSETLILLLRAHSPSTNYSLELRYELEPDSKEFLWSVCVNCGGNTTYLKRREKTIKLVLIAGIDLYKELLQEKTNKAEQEYKRLVSALEQAK